MSFLGNSRGSLSATFKPNGVMPKRNLSSGTPLRNGIFTSKSSIRGVLNVVPEENDSEGEDTNLKSDHFQQSARNLGGITIQNCRGITEKAWFSVLNLVTQILYCLTAIIYISSTADDENLYALNIVLIVLLWAILVLQILLLNNRAGKLVWLPFTKFWTNFSFFQHSTLDIKTFEF